MNHSNHSPANPTTVYSRLNGIVATTASSDEAQIRQIMADLTASLRAKDIEKSMSHYAPRIRFFDVMHTQSIGLEACRRRTEEWFSSFNGPIAYDNFDLSITAADDVAFCHSLNQAAGTRVDGGKIESSWRVTFCFRKTDNRWLIEHEHASLPYILKCSLALPSRALARETASPGGAPFVT